MIREVPEIPSAVVNNKSESVILVVGRFHVRRATVDSLTNNGAVLTLVARARVASLLACRVLLMLRYFQHISLFIRDPTQASSDVYPIIVKHHRTSEFKHHIVRNLLN